MLLGFLEGYCLVQKLLFLLYGKGLLLRLDALFCRRCRYVGFVLCGTEKWLGLLQFAVCLRGFFRDAGEQSEHFLKLAFGLFLGVCLNEILHLAQLPKIGPVGRLFEPHFALKLDYIALLMKNVLYFTQSLPELDHWILLNFVPIDTQTVG